MLEPCFQGTVQIPYGIVQKLSPILTHLESIANVVFELIPKELVGFLRVVAMTVIAQGKGYSVNR